MHVAHVFAVFACFTYALACAAAEEPSLGKPNIIWMMADDLGYGDPGCYNAKSKIRTPHIDRLAAQGMRFTDAHSPSAVCTPTRYGVLTGRYAWRTKLQSGVLLGYSPCMIEPDRLTVAALLKRNGYKTACVGKWHLGLGSGDKSDYAQRLTPGPNDLGFDYFFGIPASLDMDPYVFVENDRVLEAPTAMIAASEYVRKGGKGFWRGGAIAPSFRHSEVLPETAEKAAEFIEQHAKSSPEQPFFLYFPLSAPHTPWLPSEEFRGKSGAGTYGDFVMQVDATVGRIMQTLKDNGLADNTLFIFTSDNGAHWLPEDIEKYVHNANGALRGQKADAFEGGHRVPFIARWPAKIEAGAVSDQLSCHTDFFATVAAILGEKLTDDCAEDSFNMWPVLLGHGDEGSPRETIVHHSGSGYFAIRRGPWKLILVRGSGGFTVPQVVPAKQGEPAGQLYHLGDDPGETRDLYQHNPEIVMALTELLDAQRAAGHTRSMTTE